jgi:hypothetical protein
MSKKPYWFMVPVLVYCCFSGQALFGMQLTPQPAPQPAIAPVPVQTPPTPVMAPSAPVPIIVPATPPPAQTPVVIPASQPIAQTSYQVSITQIKDKLKTVDTFKNTLKELVSQADEIAKKCKNVIKESRLKRIEIRKTVDEKAAATFYADIEKNAQMIKTLESDLDAKTKECADISQKIKTAIDDVNNLIKQLEAQGVSFKEVQVQKEEKDDAAQDLADAAKEKKQVTKEPAKSDVKVNELQPEESYAGYVWRKTKEVFVGTGRFFYTTWVHTKDYLFAPSPAAVPAPGVPVAATQAQPVAPAQPAAPSIPVQDAQPTPALATPAQPIDPNAPAAPAQPVAPGVPVQDAQPAPQSMPIASAGVPAEQPEVDSDTQNIESRYQALNQDFENREREARAIHQTLASNPAVYEEISDQQSFKDSIKKTTDMVVDVTIDAAEKTGRFAKRVYQEKIKPFAQHVVNKVKDQFAETEAPKEQQENIEKPIPAPQMPIQ